MSLVGEQVLLRIYLPLADRPPREPTYQRILKSAREQGLSGCTVLQGILGFGPAGMLQPSAWSIVEHAPVIVEIVDSADRVQQFVQAQLSQLMTDGLATLERAHVMMYRHRKHDQPNSLKLGSLLDQPLSTIPKIESSPTMTTNTQGVLLRIFIGESDKLEGKPLYEAIVHRAREQGLAGATVLRGTEGFGANSVVHKSRLLEMSTDLPIVVEIVDTDSNVQKLLPWLEQVVQEGMITMEHVTLLMYGHERAKE